MYVAVIDGVHSSGGMLGEMCGSTGMLVCLPSGDSGGTGMLV